MEIYWWLESACKTCRYVEGSFWPNFSQVLQAVVEKMSIYRNRPCTPKSADKNMKNIIIASFHREQSAYQVLNKLLSSSLGKKCQILTLNWGTYLVTFDVTSITGPRNDIT